jgi:CPA2 family monovalent cation:H+ antiporter-2
MEEFTLVRDFAIIMSIAGGALFIFRQLKQPAILGYIVAGIILSPFTFGGWLVVNLGTIGLLADLGLVLLLFGLGLSLGWERLRGIGPKVILIGAMEVTFMVAVGYQIGTLLGWTSTEAIFLGSALAISSSAILMKTLQDEGDLHKRHGRMVVGLLVVEDFAAVLLLTVLSAVSAVGGVGPEDFGALMLKLALFFVSALLFGAIFAPRAVRYVAKMGSQETLLIASLAFCFGLALIGAELGISAAAGAFIIGVILGDTPEVEQLRTTMRPVQDMFGAIFFVSIGMLVDLSSLQDYLVPALVITAVFILGKIIANTIGSFMVGLNNRSAVRVGMAMPQLGEFSLAIGRVGSEAGVVGAFVYPVLTATTVLTAVVYPHIYRSAEAVGRFLETRTPKALGEYAQHMALWTGLKEPGRQGGPAFREAAVR